VLTPGAWRASQRKTDDWSGRGAAGAGTTVSPVP
jgi:hypothetical protein